MKNRKKLAQIAKIMLKNSLTNGLADAKRVKVVLKDVASIHPSNLSAILKIYKKLVEKALLQEEITVELASPIKNLKKLESEIITQTGVKRVRFKINADIVFGTKITHRDWIWDNTLQAKLKQLTTDNWQHLWAF